MISIIVCSIDPAKFARVTANYRTLFAEHPYEIIGIHDARSLAEGYNRGIAQARGELLIFSHDDVEILSTNLADTLLRATSVLDVVGLVGTSRVLTAYWPQAGHPFLHGWITHPMSRTRQFAVTVYGVAAPLETGLQALDGMFFAVKREALRHLTFDAETFDGFHGYDLDFSFAAYRAGFKVGTTAEIALIHESAGDFDETWRLYARRFAEKYGLPSELPQPRWALARVIVNSSDSIVRDFPLQRLVAISEHLRSSAAGTSR